MSGGIIPNNLYSQIDSVESRNEIRFLLLKGSKRSKGKFPTANDKSWVELSAGFILPHLICLYLYTHTIRLTHWYQETSNQKKILKRSLNRLPLFCPWKYASPKRRSPPGPTDGHFVVRSIWPSTVFLTLTRRTRINWVFFLSGFWGLRGGERLRHHTIYIIDAWYIIAEFDFWHALKYTIFGLILSLFLFVRKLP